jgi:hypothetical protein
MLVQHVCNLVYAAAVSVFTSSLKESRRGVIFEMMNEGSKQRAKTMSQLSLLFVVFW